MQPSASTSRPPNGAPAGERDDVDGRRRGAVQLADGEVEHAALAAHRAGSWPARGDGVPGGSASRRGAQRVGVVGLDQPRRRPAP